MFKSFDDDGGGTLDIKELKPCLMALQDAALAAQAQQAAELQRAELCDERAKMYRAAEATMKAITAEEERNAQLIAKHPLEVRIGLSMRKSKKCVRWSRSLDLWVTARRASMPLAHPEVIVSTHPSAGL